MWIRSLSFGINFNSLNTHAISLFNCSHKCQDTRFPPTITALCDPSSVFQHCFAVFDMEVLPTEGCQLKNTVFLLVSDDTVSSPALPGLGEQALSLSVHMMLAEQLVKPLSEGSCWISVTTMLRNVLLHCFSQTFPFSKTNQTAWKKRASTQPVDPYWCSMQIITDNSCRIFSNYWHLWGLW